MVWNFPGKLFRRRIPQNRRRGRYLGKTYYQKNNLFLLDARLGITDKLGILGEYLYSQYDSVEKGRVEDSSLIVGPFFKKEGLSFQANYRNLGRDFHFIGRSYQTATNQEGVYVDGDIRLKKIYLYGSTDYYWDDPGPEIERNRLFTWASNLGASFYPRQNWYFNLTSSVIKKEPLTGQILLMTLDMKYFQALQPILLEVLLILT
ncbi:MAG: hypothetical protein KIIPBIDF_00128 [Candidatus Methanoperedenaceae archaeon GB50]|nr:MAG: hypothetical protein KIIPBIDF_00128 [Candidatus Methanoperedenaceae archaeon GB50]